MWDRWNVIQDFHQWESGKTSSYMWPRKIGLFTQKCRACDPERYRTGGRDEPDFENKHVWPCTQSSRQAGQTSVMHTCTAWVGVYLGLGGGSLVTCCGFNNIRLGSSTKLPKPQLSLGIDCTCLTFLSSFNRFGIWRKSTNAKISILRHTGHVQAKPRRIKTHRMFKGRTL